MRSIKHTQQLADLVYTSPNFIANLVAVRSVGLASWCIGAGAIRNLVWDALHGYAVPSALSDVDVAYFDATDLEAARDTLLQRQLAMLRASVPWEVTNRAAVHRWYEGTFGHPVEPLQSLYEAIASWPETATAVGVVLHDDDRLDVIAPFGLDDLFGIIVRRNATRVSVDIYHERIRKKSYAERWPRVKVFE